MVCPVIVPVRHMVTTMSAQSSLSADFFNREAAAERGVSLNTLRRWSDSGKLTCYRSPGGHRRYRRGDVEALLRAEDLVTRCRALYAGYEFH